MDPLISLSSRRFNAGVSPRLGGALAWFGLAHDPGVEFLRPTPAKAYAANNVRLTSCYPLVPYSNRIGDGRFSFEGVDHVLRGTSVISPHPLHGLGWLRAWDVTATTPESVSLALRHDARGPDDPEWPWSFSATQRIAVDETGLHITVTLTNEDSSAMPAGIGLHPFFPKSPRMELQFEAAAVWRNDARMLPVERAAVPAEWQFTLRRPVGELTVDNCFAGWSRSALLYWPERGWGMHLDASDAFGHLVVFTAPGRDNIAIEPVSHANNAVNLAAARGDTGLVTLEPDATLSGAFTMIPFQLEDGDEA